MNTQKLLLLLLFGWGISGANAQTLYVRPASGTQVAYDVNGIQKLTFADGHLQVAQIDGPVESYSLSGLRYLNFTDLTLGANTHELAKKAFFVFPNPAKGIVNISAASSIEAGAITQVEILSLEGRLLLTQRPTAVNNVQADITTLPSGMYLCKITAGHQTQTVKFLKQ